MSAITRRKNFAESIRSELEDAKLDQVGRIKWLVEHIQVYLDRWIGFTSVTSISEIVQSDFHSVLLVAIDIIDAEMHELTGSSGAGESWRNFASTARMIDKDSSKEVAELLEARFADFRRRVAAAGPSNPL